MLTAIAYQLRRETDAAHEQAEALIALAMEQGFELFGRSAGSCAAGRGLRSASGGSRSAEGFDTADLQEARALLEELA